MDVRATAGQIEVYAADAIIVNVFEGEARPSGATSAVDYVLNGAISDLIRDGDFSGKLGQVAVLYTRGSIPAKRVLITGMGKAETLSVDTIRRAAAHAILKARELKVQRVASILHGTGAGNIAVDVAAQAITEGSLLALYRYHGYKSSPAPEDFPKSLDLLILDERDRRAALGIADGQAIAAGVNLARDLVNAPPNVCSPEYLAQAAVEMAASVGLTSTVLDRAQMEALKMGALLGVAQGSDQPPQFIILDYNADKTDLPTVVLVGKGVTFDTGGYDIKTSDGMGTMKGDMAGGAAVIGAMRAIAGIQPRLHVVGLIPTADNMISSHAYRPQDVLTASNGVTIEIISTDAEGRLLLADALVYANRYQPAAVVDIATLTGSCVTALGQHVAAGLFSTEDKVRDTLMAAGTETAEKLWPLPLFPEYDKTIESTVADIKNSGGARGGVGTSAIFLKHFVNYPWAHIDMAGMTFDAPDNPLMPKGATGFGARLLTEFALRWANPTG